MTNKYPKPKKCPYCKKRLSYFYGSYVCSSLGCLGRPLHGEQLKPDKSKGGYQNRRKEQRK